jgi:prepilin-type N-terminal cleavage/methylation domain-containing protein
MKKNRFFEGGFSLVEVLIAVGISGALALAFSSMMASQGKQMNVMTEKMSIIDFGNMVISEWSDANICTKQILEKEITFNSTDPNAVINLDELKGNAETTLAKVGEPISPNHPALKVDTIQINHISGKDDSFTARLQLRFKSHDGRGVKPIQMSIKLKTLPASPNDKKLVVVCGGANSLLASAGGGETYSCIAKRNSLCSVPSDAGMSLCALSKYYNKDCAKCGGLSCEIIGPDGQGVFILNVQNGDDPDAECAMTCI